MVVFVLALLASVSACAATPVDEVAATVVPDPVESTAQTIEPIDAAPADGVDTSVLRIEGTADELIAVFSADSPVQGQARVGGELVELEGGCIGFADGSLALWPSQARFEAGRIVFPDGESFGVGDTFEGGGGYFDQWYVDAGQPCPATSFVSVDSTS